MVPWWERDGLRVVNTADGPVRALSVVAFAVAGLIALLVGYSDVSQEADISWADAKPRALALFAGANIVAAALAAVRGASIAARVAGVLLLVPAVYVLVRFDSPHSDAKLSTGLPVALVLAGGLIASGLTSRLLGRREL